MTSLSPSKETQTKEIKEETDEKEEYHMGMKNLIFLSANLLSTLEEIRKMMRDIHNEYLTTNALTSSLFTVEDEEEE